MSDSAVERWERGRKGGREGGREHVGLLTWAAGEPDDERICGGVGAGLEEPIKVYRTMCMRKEMSMLIECRGKCRCMLP